MAIMVPSTSPTNFPRPPSVYKTIVDSTRRLDILERNSGLRSASIGAGGIRLYDSGSLRLEGGNIVVLNSDDEIETFIGDGLIEFLDNEIRTGIIGEFDGQYYDADLPGWVPAVERGFALFRASDPFPYFSVGNALGTNRLDLTAGFNQGADNRRLDSFQIDAHHTTLHGGDDPDGDARLTMLPTGQVILESTNLAQTVNIGFSVSNVAISVDPAGQFTLFNIGSTTNPANLRRESNVVLIVTSAAKFKEDIQQLDVDLDELFSVSGRTWLDLGQMEAYRRQKKAGKRDVPAFGSDTERHAYEASVVAGDVDDTVIDHPGRVPGFVADEWAEHASLRQFVEFDDVGEPHGILYERVAAGLLEAGKDHHARIAALEATVERLSEKLGSKP